MTTTPNTTLTDQLTPLAAQLAALQAQITALTEQADTIKTRIRDLVAGPDTYDAGEVAVIVSPNTRFDAKKALPLIPDALRPLVVETTETVNKDRLKALAPAIFEQAQSVGEYRVSLR